jgi:hypothetical protein
MFVPAFAASGFRLAKPATVDQQLIDSATRESGK